MKTRTWPYGTRKRVRVFSATMTADTTVIGVEEISLGRREIFLLILNTADVPQNFDAMTDDCLIEFTAGGPTGGYWRIIDPANEPVDHGQARAK